MNGAVSDVSLNKICYSLQSIISVMVLVPLIMDRREYIILSISQKIIKGHSLTMSPVNTMNVGKVTRLLQATYLTVLWNGTLSQTEGKNKQ
jgi:hypothetical protein